MKFDVVLSLFRNFIADFADSSSFFLYCGKVFETKLYDFQDRVGQTDFHLSAMLSDHSLSRHVACCVVEGLPGLLICCRSGALTSNNLYLIAGQEGQVKVKSYVYVD